MNQVVAELPHSFFYIIGLSIFMNLGVIGVLITFIFKVGMFVAETKIGIKDAKDSSVRAHVRIDEIKKT